MIVLRWFAVLLLAVLMVTAIVFVGRAFADDTCFAFDTLTENYAASGYRIVELTPLSTKAVGKRKGIAATRGFVVLYGEQMLLGLEVAGCTLPPIVMGPNDLAFGYSGLTPWGLEA